jgi:hypothetical protein
MKKRIKVKLKPALERHPSLHYLWDPKQTDEMHPHHPVRSRDLDTLQALRMQMNHSLEEVMRDGSLGELSSTLHIMQCVVHVLYYGRELKRAHDKRKR